MTNHTDNTKRNNPHEPKNPHDIDIYEANQLLQGQTVLIIGGARGISLGTAYAEISSGSRW